MILPATTAALAGNALTLSAAFTFDPSFTGSKTIFTYGANAIGVSSGCGWQARGTWVVP